MTPQSTLETETAGLSPAEKNALSTFLKHSVGRNKGCPARAVLESLELKMMLKQASRPGRLA